MDRVRARSINTNPLQFEEFATSMASLSGYFQDGENAFGVALDRLDQLFAKARKQPLGYRDVTDLAGQSLNSIDERSGRAAWLLQHTEGLRVLGVHSLVRHNAGQRLYAPWINQLGIALGESPKSIDSELNELGRDGDWLDVVGIKNDAIWLVKVLTERSILDSAVKRIGQRQSLFRTRVFSDRNLDPDSVSEIRIADQLARHAFPNHEVLAMCVVLHTELPDFELYQIGVTNNATQIKLTEDCVVRNSIDFTDIIAEDHELLWCVPTRHDADPLFRGIPPCRGGRSLNILAAVAQKQLKSTSLLEFRQKDIAEILESDFGFDVTRDKIRHDLEDRLASQGLMRKWGNIYFLTLRGVARYFYFLAKYSTTTVGDAMSVIDACSQHRERIVSRFGYLV